MATLSRMPDERFPRFNRLWTVVALVTVLGLVVGIRIRLLDVPLERDEGEYAYVGQLMLEGVSPYEHVYTMKWPGTHGAYAVIMAVFGQTAAGIHMGLTVITLATALMVFVLARRLAGDFAGVIAAGSYALFSISPSTLGLAAHATHFVVLPALAGILLLQNLDERISALRVFIAGLLLGLAALMKQSGAAFGLFAACWVVWVEIRRPEKHWRRLLLRLGCLALGGLMPLIATCAVLAAFGVFDRFWLWTFHYARAYASIMTLKEGMQLFFQVSEDVFKSAPALWCLSLAGLLLLFCERAMRSWLVFVLGFAGFSFLAICPGLYFRAHYFLLLLPAAALLAGVAASAGLALLARSKFRLNPALLVVLLFCGAGLQMLLKSRDIFFTLSPTRVCMAIHDVNPFPESVEIGSYLASHCPPDGRIAVIGSEPQIYFYSRRQSATGYIYMYPLMEPQPYAEAMQKEMMQEIERTGPDYLVYVNVPFSWLKRPESRLSIFDWFARYQRDHLQLVGLIDILPGDETKYRWSSSDTHLEPESDHWLAVYQNKNPTASK